MSDFKPCPFCGEDKKINTEQLDARTWIVACGNCGTTSGMWHTEEEVINFWNKRATINDYTDRDFIVIP